MVALLAIGAGVYVAWTYVFVHQVQVAKEMNWRCVPDAATAERSRFIDAFLKAANITWGQTHPLHSQPPQFTGNIEMLGV